MSKLNADIYRKKYEEAMELLKIAREELVRNSTLLDLAYLAGVIDSDGSISISKRNTHRSRVSYQGLFQLTWTQSPETLKFIENLKARYGGSYFLSEAKKGRFKNAKPIVKYCLTTNNLTPLLKDVFPYLRLKKAQAVNAIRLDSLNKHCRRYGQGKSKPQRIADIQERLYLRNRKVNSKNGS